MRVREREENNTCVTHRSHSISQGVQSTNAMLPLVRHLLSVGGLVSFILFSGQAHAQTGGQYNCTVTANASGKNLSLTCTKKPGGGGGGGGGAHAFEVRNIQRYPTSIDASDWLKFDIRANVTAAQRFHIRLKFFQPQNSFTLCNEYFYSPTKGQVENETSIPSVCEADVQWGRVQISSGDQRVCKGCGVFRSGPRNLDSGLSGISIVFQAAVPKPVVPKYTTSGVRRPSEL